MADADDTTTGTSPFTPTPVIAEAWRRAKTLQLAYLRARGATSRRRRSGRGTAARSNGTTRGPTSGRAGGREREALTPNRTADHT